MTVRLRLSHGAGRRRRSASTSVDAVMTARMAEADEFYASITPPATSAEEARR